ncbi:MAG: peptidoglycan recognition protein family protein [Pseudonocardia sp.]
MQRDDPGRGISRRGLLGSVAGLAAGLAAGGVLLTDPQPGGRIDPVAGRAALPGPVRPKVLSCTGWRARDPSEPVSVLPRRPIKIIVHHTATRNRDDPLTLSTLARAIQDFHMDTNDWIDSGHHFLINRQGLIAEGRHRSLETLLGGRRMVEGTHCPGQNDCSIGIENEGTYTESNPPPGQLVMLRVLCAFTCLQYGLRPGEIYGHRDFRDTACPGDRLYALLPSLRRSVARLLRPGVDVRTVGSPPTWPLLRIADRGQAVLAAQHLLRAAGVPGVPADGQFGRATADGVYDFQRRHGLELTGMIGGGSWPLLAVPVRRGQGGEAELAVRALLATDRGGGQGWTVPDTVTTPAWQRLLGTG